MGKPAKLAHTVEDALDKVAIRESADIGCGLVVLDIGKYMSELVAHNNERAQVAAVGQVEVREFVLEQPREWRKSPK